MMRGIIHDMPAADYFAIDALSNSIAKIGLSRSWFHARQSMKGGMRAFSDEFDLGTAAHELLLEGSAARICIIDAENWRTKAAKESRDKARSDGMTPILAKHNRALTEMVDQARMFVDKTEFAGIFMRGRAEETLVWHDEGLRCKSRMDWLTDAGDIIMDYKTTENAVPEQFGRSIAKYGYDFQAEWYSRGIEAVTNSRPLFIFLAQESSYPYACSLHSLSNAYQEIAQAKVQRAIDEYRACLEFDEWPAYRTDVHYQEPTSWALNAHMAAMEDDT